MNFRLRSPKKFGIKVWLGGFVVAFAAAGIILTSSIEERDLMHGYGLGANSYIRKPGDFEQVTASVSQIGLYWLVSNDRPAAASRGGK